MGAATYHFPTSLPVNGYGLSGQWEVGAQHITARTAAGIAINYQAKNIFAVLGGSGTVTVSRNGAVVSTFVTDRQPRLYTLHHNATNRGATLTLRVGKGVEAYTFTFG